MPVPRSLRAKIKKQTRLAFSPLPSSSPTKEQYPTAVQNRLADVRHTGSKVTPASFPPGLQAEHESNLPTPEPSSQADQRQYQETTSGSQSSSDEDAAPSTKRRRLARRAGGQEFEQSTPTRKPTRVTRESAARSQRQEDTRRAPAPRQLASSSDDGSEFAGADAISELGEPETTGDEDDVLVTKPTQRRRQQKKAAEDPFVVDDDRVEYISSDDDTPPNTRRKPRKLAGDNWLAGGDEIEYITSNDEAPPSSRKNTKKASLRRRSRHEQEELEDDLADLRDSDHSDEAATKTPRTRGGPVTTQRDKARQHFELLKRRRAGEKVPRVLDSDGEEDDEPEPVNIDNIGNDELLGAPHVLSDDSSAHGDDAAEDQPEGAEDDFVVDDVSSRRLGLPHPDIPLEFTSYASAKPKDLFLHVIEWLLKNRIAPAFNRDDPIYKLALSKVSDQVTAQAGSRLISAAWNADFKYAILARPNVTMTFLEDDDDMHTCDACNRANHPAQYDFVLAGEPYKKRDLEPVNDHSDDEEDEKQEYDEAGHLLPSQNTHFYLGRYCAANAEMGHKLVHWQYHLNQNLLGYLEEQGVLSAKATLARDKMNGKKREKEAEAIVDSMEETGVINELWRAFQSDLDDARLGMEDFEKRGKRGQGRIGSVRSTGKDGLVREWNKDTMTILGRAESDDED